MATINDKIEQQMEDLDSKGLLKSKNNDGVIERNLTRCLRSARASKANGDEEYVNVLFIGYGGSGKTSRIKAWCKENGITPVEVHSADLDQTDMGGAVAPDKTNTYVTRLSPTEMNELDQENTILFLDEYNRAMDAIRGTLLTLIENHTVYDAKVPGKRRTLKGMLFTVAAINPMSADFNVQQLDGAEESRFKTVHVESDPSATLSYLGILFDQSSEAYKIAKLLLQSKNFSFTEGQELERVMSSGNRKPLSARTLTRLLKFVNDNYKEEGIGFKEMFLDEWNSFCDDSKKTVITAILANYHDVDDKANNALKSGTDSGVFTKRKSISDELLKLGSSN